MRTSLLLLRMWVAALSGRGSYMGGARGSRDARAAMPGHRGTASGPFPSHPAAPKGPGAEIFPIAPRIPSHSHTTTSRKPHAPPARAARPRRPLAPPVRAARSRRTLAPSARAAASLHRRRTLMVSLGFPIPSHLHTIASRHPKAPSHAGMAPP